MTYTLFYKGNEIAEVKELYMEFPGFLGAYTLSKSMEELQEEQPLLADWITFSIELDEVLEKNPEADKEGYRSRAAKFRELFESNEWKLVDERGMKHKIQFPVFQQDSEMTWKVL